jgi:hypothetical protein
MLRLLISNSRDNVATNPSADIDILTTNIQAILAKPP